jgi:hypothetical protein
MDWEAVVYGRSMAMPWAEVPENVTVTLTSCPKGALLSDTLQIKGARTTRDAGISIVTVTVALEASMYGAVPNASDGDSEM